jgi:starch synthase (maltosyl-transferring)
MPETTRRILYADPQQEAPEASFATASALGFTHVLLPPPWPPSARGDRFAPAALDGPVLGAWGRAAAAAGLGLLLDVQVNRLAAGAGAVLGEGLFHATDPRAVLDPRHGVDLDADTAFPHGAAEAAELGAFWARHAKTWAAQGVAGIRLLGLDAIAPDCLGAFLSALASGTPGLALFVWAPGMSREAMLALRGQGLAGIFSSFPWWDLRSAWFWDELAVLRQAAPVIHAPEAPFGQRIAGSVQDPAEAPALYHRAAILAATLGEGWMALAGAETAAGADLRPIIRGLNQLADRSAALRGAAPPVLPAGTGGPVLAVLRTDAADRRYAHCAAMAVVNTDTAHQRTIDPALLLTPLGGRFTFLEQKLPVPRRLGLEPLVLEPAEALVFVAEEIARPTTATKLEAASARLGAAAPRLAIEAVAPAVDGGLFPVKRTAGEAVTVTADLLFDGHEKIAGALRWRGPNGSGGFTAWQETRMAPLGNDRWQAAFALTLLGRYEYVVSTWRDAFETFRDEIAKKHAAGVDITVELQEGVALVVRFAAGAEGEAASQLRAIAAGLDKADTAARREILLSAPVARLMASADPRPFAVDSAAIPVDAERLEARFASWYEVFPRSLSDDPARHGTFDDVVRHLPRIAAMGFDVLYFPPIHPIGRKNRKGRNNTLTPAPEDPGSPYAIGNAQGGHDALHPELGNFDSFRRLREAAAGHGLELAMDFAIQCAPDHPWLTEHPGWFDWRPDGTIKYAENPPKKYEDIVNVDFYADDAVPGLWLELCRVVLFWASQGVRLFRVDNPHTKPFPFWEWMIREVRQRYPDAVFLAEAFTRPKIMYRLAKIGFSQSYTYFTWRNTKTELAAYSTELAETAPRDFFRPHFFVNTPDINPVFLQSSGRPGFLIRAALASTLSGLWGVYNGFELCEGTPLAPGKEEYLDSEKYQLRAWDWDRPGNIVAEITALNRLRRENPALQSHLTVRFLNAFNDTILYYEKSTPDRSNVLLVAVSLDPFQAQEADFEIPLWEWGYPDDASLDAVDLLTGMGFTWHGKRQHMRLTPEQPFAIWRVAAAGVR